MTPNFELCYASEHFYRSTFNLSVCKLRRYFQNQAADMEVSDLDLESASLILHFKR